MHCHTLGDVEAAALVALPADTLPKAKHEPHCYRQTKAQREALVDTLPERQRASEVGTICKTQSDVETETQVHTKTDTLLDSHGKKLALIDTLADMYRWLRPDTIHVTLGDVQAQALFNTLADTLQKTEE